MINPISKVTLTISNFVHTVDVRFVPSDVIATRRKYRHRLATGGKFILFKHFLLSFVLENNRVIVIENRQNIFQLQLQLSTFENRQLQLQLQQNLLINYNFVNCNYNFSKSDNYIGVLNSLANNAFIFLG